MNGSGAPHPGLHRLVDNAVLLLTRQAESPFLGPGNNLFTSQTVRMDGNRQMDEWMACPRCDQLYDLSGLADGDKARCKRCSELLTTFREDGLHRVLAGSLAAFIFLIIALSYPFLSFRSSGVEAVMTLPSALGRLSDEGMPEMAVIVAVFILIIPALILWMASALSLALLVGRRPDWVVPVARWIFHLKSWSMAEVFLIGVIVSLVKIMHMATVIIGLSFWAYIGFIVCFTLSLANLDAFQVWRRIEKLGLCEA